MKNIEELMQFLKSKGTFEQALERVLVIEENGIEKNITSFSESDHLVGDVLKKGITIHVKPEEVETNIKNDEE